MIPIYVRTVIDPPAPSKRAHQRWARDAHGRMGEVFQREILQARFEGKVAYPHRKRSPAYLKQKENAAKRGVAIEEGKIVNVYTGAMKKALLSSARIRAYPTRFTLQATGTRYIDMRVYKANQPDKWAELTAVQSEQERRLSAAFLMRYEQNREAERQPPIDHRAT